MAQEFVSNSTGSARPNSDAGEPEREPVEFIILGSREGIKEQINKLYALNFAEVYEWSPIMRVPNSHRMMTILIRYRKRKPTDSSTRKSGR